MEKPNFMRDTGHSAMHLPKIYQQIMTFAYSIFFQTVAMRKRRLPGRQSKAYGVFFQAVQHQIFTLPYTVQLSLAKPLSGLA